MLSQTSIYLSIVIPAFNEEPNIAQTLDDIADLLKDKPYSYEIIVVDDGSRDKTKEITSSKASLFQNFILLENTLNCGKGNAVKKGVLASSGELVLFMDADNSTRINQIDKLIFAINQGYDVAIASRRVPGAVIEGSQPITRIILGNIYIVLSRIILGTKVKDYNCGFKLYKKEAAQILFSRLKQDDWSFDSELIYLAKKFNLKIKEAPVRWVDKRTSKVRPLRDGIKSFLSLLRIRFSKISP